jgi:hypothetical protein
MTPNQVRDLQQALENRRQALPAYTPEEIEEKVEDCKESLDIFSSKLKRENNNIINSLHTYMPSVLKTVYNLHDLIGLNESRVTKDQLFADLLPREFENSTSFIQNTTLLQENASLKTMLEVVRQQNQTLRTQNEQGARNLQ